MTEEFASFLMAVGYWGGLVVIGIGKIFIGRRDGRTKTGWKKNRKPKWIPGLLCYVAGAVWMGLSVYYTFFID